MKFGDITILRDADADQALGMTRGGNRYGYDLAFMESEGWEEYDTDQDAWYFGVWVHVGDRKVFTYAEGDRILEVCHTQEEFTALLRRMATFYGKAPPFLRTYDKGEWTAHYSARPGDHLLNPEAQEAAVAA